MSKALPLEFRNCRNIVEIEDGALPLEYDRLNVLFGSNGTGKTTVSKVLDLWSSPADPDKLEALKSFKYMESQDASDAPDVPVVGKRARPVLVFNSEWVSDHCFQEDGNLQSGAYGLYVSSPEVRKLERERKRLLTKLNVVLNGEEAEEVRKLAETVAKNVGTSARGKVGNAFKDNAPLEGLPHALEGVAKGMKDQDKTQWMRWHVQGATHAENASPSCPYCGSETPGMQEIIDFDNMHAAKQGDAWNSAVSVFAEGRLFRVTVNRKALRLMSGAKRLDDDDKNWVMSQAQRAKDLSDCITKARDTVATYGGDSSDRFFDQLKEFLITMRDEAGFTDATRLIMRSLASAIGAVLRKEKTIRDVVGKLESHAAANAAKYKAEIDFVLERCGYPYSIEINSNCSIGESRVALLPTSTGVAYSGHPRRALSYGEQNTLALVLFMFEAISQKKSCIIVLDDPISSFDGDKRFTLLYRMFHNFKADDAHTDRESLAGRTVVLLTHDYLVVSDVLTILGNKVGKPRVLRLTCGKNGVLAHREIGADAVRPYVQMIRRRVRESAGRDEFFQLVYLRCYCEMIRLSSTDRNTSEGCAFVVISILVDDYDWDRALRVLKWDGVSNPPYVLKTGENFIRRYIPDFDFKNLFGKLRDDAELCRLYGSPDITPYEKLQVLRLLIRQSKVGVQSPVMVRYANEVYHLAGDYLLQLDPVDFNPVAPFVLDWCDATFSEFTRSLAG